MQQLIDMGYTNVDRNFEVARKSNGDLGVALNYLLEFESKPEDLKKDKPVQRVPQPANPSPPVNFNNPPAWLANQWPSQPAQP